MRYNIKNEALLGACFLPIGLGMVALPIAGRLSDRLVVHYRGREWYAEDCSVFMNAFARSSSLRAFIGPLVWTFDTIRVWNVGFGSHPPLFIHERNR